MLFPFIVIITACGPASKDSAADHDGADDLLVTVGMYNSGIAIFDGPL